MTVTTAAIKQFAREVIEQVAQEHPDYKQHPTAERSAWITQACAKVGAADATMQEVLRLINYYKAKLSQPRLRGVHGTQREWFVALDADAKLGHRAILYIGTCVNSKFGRTRFAPEPAKPTTQASAWATNAGAMTVSTNGNGSEPAVTFSRSLSAYQTYKYLVEHFDVVPSDAMMEWFTGVSPTSFSTARRMLRAAGYMIESVAGYQWAVTQRPQKAEVLRQQLQDALKQRLEKADAQELTRLMAALNA